MGVSPRYTPDPRIEALGEGFYDIVEAARFPKLILRFRNQPWAERIGLGDLSPEEWQTHFAEFEPLPRNLVHPLALRYHGHQFRSYNPDLGDGRGFLFAQLRDPSDQRLLDLGTKGSGQTPFSRSGDGRLTLKGAVREALATEMLEWLGVNTSKTFSFFETGESLIRNDEPSPTRAAVLVRLSHSHIRFGSFQRHAAYRDQKRLEALLTYSIENFDPDLKSLTLEEQIVGFIRRVSERSARTCAAWMIAGFVHGVLNTDNMNITGESFDYGPWRFLPTYDSRFTAAYFDHSGLYAYGRQPESVIWNLEQLASCFLLLWPEGKSTEPISEAIGAFTAAFNHTVIEKFLDRLGLEPLSADENGDLLSATFEFLNRSQVGYDQFFFDWYAGTNSTTRARTGVAQEFYQHESFSAVFEKLQLFSARADAVKRLSDSYFQRAKPCSMLIDEVEWIWEPIASQDDWTRFDKKIEDIRRLRHLWGRELYSQT